MDMRAIASHSRLDPLPWCERPAPGQAGSDPVVHPHSETRTAKVRACAMTTAAVDNGPRFVISTESTTATTRPAAQAGGSMPWKHPKPTWRCAARAWDDGLVTQPESSQRLSGGLRHG
jgi:hypothetical protein